MSQIYNYEAEMSVLGSMLLDDGAAAAICEVLKVDDFYRNAHRILFKIFADFVARRKPIDILTVHEVLTRTNQLEEIGSEDYLLEVAEYVPSPANAMYYAALVQEYATRRRMQGAANRILRMVDEGAEPEKFTDFVGALVGRVGASGAFPAVNVGDIRISDERMLGVPTGWKSLDLNTGTDGLAKGQVYMVSADTGRGKSTLMHSAALAMAMEGKRVLYVVWADLDADTFRARTVKMLTGWGKRPYNLEKATDYDQAVADLDMGVYQLQFLDVVAERMPELEIFFAHLLQDHKRKPYDAVFMDYAQSFELSKKTQNEVDKQVQCARLCAVKCKELRVALVIGSQVGEDGKTAYSREWERVCAMNLLITDEGLLVKKSRHFGQSKGTTLPIQFNRDYSRYEDRAA